MKKIFTIIALLSLFQGCSLFHGGDGTGSVVFQLGGNTARSALTRFGRNQRRNKN